MMKCDFIADEGMIVIKPKRKYPAGYELEISFSDDQVCFSIVDKKQTLNVQLDIDEYNELINFLSNLKLKWTFGRNKK